MSLGRAATSCYTGNMTYPFAPTDVVSSVEHAFAPDPVAEADEFADIIPAATDRLRSPKVEPVPPSIVRLAQLFLDGQPHPTMPGKKTHVGMHEFQPGEEARRDDFVRHLRNAGHYTTPQSKVTPNVDDDNPLLVTYRVGLPRTRTT